MLATGGEEEQFSRRTIPKLHVFDQFFLTFDVNLVFTATLACTKRALFITKRALFITKKGTFSPLKKLGGGGTCPRAPRFLRPWLHACISSC